MALDFFVCLLADVFNIGCWVLVESLDRNIHITAVEFLRQIICVLILVHIGKNFCGKAAAYLPL